MRSDREEIPAPFTKADADKAETLEAQANSKSARSALAADCQYYWPSPNAVCGAIRDKYNQMGGPNSFLLYPKSDELSNPDGFGKRSEFLGGNIYWSSATGAHPVAHEFLTKWGDYGFEGGFMKYPTTDEIINPDGIGRRQVFQNAHIFWSIQTGAHESHGLIRDEWARRGWESGELGYPTSDEIASTGQIAQISQRAQYYTRGALFYDSVTGTVFKGVFEKGTG